MRRAIISFFVLIVFLTATSGLALAAWADYFTAPEGLEPGGLEAPGQIVNILTPELKFVTVGPLSYIYLFQVEDVPVTLAEQFSNKPIPVLMAKVNSSSLQIPSGILFPGKSYYWYVLSIHNPGTKSEAIKSSPKLYFATAQDSK